MIETKRLILRNFKLEDSKSIFLNWARDERVTRYLRWDIHKDIKETENYVKTALNNPYAWVIVLKSNNEIIGTIDLIGKNDFGVYEIGYVLAYKYWNNGYMSESLNAVINYLFDNGFNKLGACHHIDNIASGKVMKKCGMKYKTSFEMKRKFNLDELCTVDYYEIEK